MEVEVGIGDNQFPMHLSISHCRVEDTDRRKSHCWRMTEVVSGENATDSNYSAYNRYIAIHAIRSYNYVVGESKKS